MCFVWPSNGCRWPASRQRQHLIRLGVAPSTDELALDFDAAFRAVDIVADAPGISAAALESLRTIDRLLDQAGNGEPDVWHVSGLEGSGTWDKVRRLAADAIRELGTPPDA